MGGEIGRIVFAPHVDDEVLGCFAFLGPDTEVVYGGIEDRPSRPIRQAELDTSAAALGFAHRSLDHTVNRFDANDLIEPFETIINDRKPHTVLIPEPSYNQDHRAVYDAAITATRPHDKNWRVDRVLIYEQPDSVLWRHGDIEQPTVFVPINVESKVEAYLRYQSQVRGHRSPDHVRALAVLRGAHIGVSAAEAFHLRRLVLEPS